MDSDIGKESKVPTSDADLKYEAIDDAREKMMRYDDNASSLEKQHIFFSKSPPPSSQTDRVRQ